jgi:hypothetical protein
MFFVVVSAIGYHCAVMLSVKAKKTQDNKCQFFHFPIFNGLKAGSGIF